MQHILNMTVIWLSHGYPFLCIYSMSFLFLHLMKHPSMFQHHYISTFLVLMKFNFNQNVIVLIDILSHEIIIFCITLFNNFSLYCRIYF